MSKLTFMIQSMAYKKVICGPIFFQLIAKYSGFCPHAFESNKII